MARRLITTLLVAPLFASTFVAPADAQEARVCVTDEEWDFDPPLGVSGGSGSVTLNYSVIAACVRSDGTTQIPNDGQLEFTYSGDCGFARLEGTDNNSDGAWSNGVAVRVELGSGFIVVGVSTVVPPDDCPVDVVSAVGESVRVD